MLFSHLPTMMSVRGALADIPNPTHHIDKCVMIDNLLVRSQKTLLIPSHSEGLPYQIRYQLATRRPHYLVKSLVHSIMMYGYGDTTSNAQNNEEVDVYYDREDRAPYLQVSSSDMAVQIQKSQQKQDKDDDNNKEEADAAAGGNKQSVMKRVSSFSIMARGAINSSTTTTNSNTPGQREAPTASLRNRNGANHSNIATNGTHDSYSAHTTMTPSWRLRDRMKTVGVGLVMALNVGTDPPDITKPHPCAKLQCWMDPSSVTRQKAKEKIGERLESQYARWQQQRAARPLKYRRALDPTVEDVRALCLWLRRQARHERILLHYNGHGVPRPTANGEIWVFDKNHTEYIPLSVSDLRQWMGKPSIVVLDCSSAGILIPFLTCPLPSENENVNNNNPSSTSTTTTTTPTSPEPQDMETAASNWVKDTIVLCPTSDQEWLPMHPDYPADVFTSCLTTPIQMALRWFVRRNRQSMGGLNPEAVDAIPGKPNDRKTPLGELNWIFTAVTDSIAWNVLPKALFQRLFRQDLLVASMFRNFLLADRILRSLNCTPQSYPPLPPGVADHPMWQAWDLACETCLAGLLKDGILGNHVVKSVAPTPTTTTTTSLDGTETTASILAPPASTTPPLPEAPKTGPASSISSPFFSEQLTAFEIWLEFASIHKATLEGWEGDEDPPLESPEQLPVVLQVLLSQVHRIRALLLLRRFLDLGPWAVNLSLSLGIFPYVMKLLQSPEYKSLLVSIWASILKFDPSCQVDLVKDGALPHFIQPLTTWNVSNNKLAADAAKQRTLSAFALAATCYNYPTAQTECLRQNLHGHCCALLSSFSKSGERGGHDPNHQPHLAQYEYEQDQAESSQNHLPPTARLWLCICLGNLVKNNLPAQQEAYNSNVHRCLASQFQDKSPSVRAAVCYALACLLEHTPRSIAVVPNKGGGVVLPSTPTPHNMAPPSYTHNAPGVTPFSPGAQGLVPLQMSATTMSVPAALTASTVMSGQLRPNMGNQPPNDGMGNPMWNPQGQPQGPHQVLGPPQMHVQQGHPQGGPQPHLLHQHQQPLNPRMVAPPNAGQPGMRMGPPGQPMMSPGGAPLSHQQHLLRPQPGQPMTAPMLGSHRGQTVVMNVMSPHHSHGSPGGGTPHLMTQMVPPPVSPENMSRRRPSVFEDTLRVELDLNVVEILLKALNDGSTVVRYEAIMALGCVIGKYLAAYLVVAEEMSTSSPPTAEEKESEKQPVRANIVPSPQGVTRLMLDQFAASWKAIRSVQHKDTHPNIARAANAIVSVVHEQLLDLRVEIEMKASEEAKMASDTLAGIEEEGVDIERTFSEQLLVLSPDTDGPRRQIQSDGPLHRLPFRRTASDLGTPFGWQSNSNDPRNAMQLSQGSCDALESTNQHRKEYSLPKSKFYEWKTETFQSSYDSSEDDFLLERDPLCPSGAAHAYQRRRNMAVREAGRKLAQHFVALAPKPPKRKQGLDMMLEDDDEADEKDLSLKVDLKLREKKLLRNTGVEMTSMLKFHAYEDVLMVCDNQGGISVWDYEKGNRCSVYQNCNPKGSRMTTAFWINESSSSLFFVGCDDGSARIWDGIVESNGEISREPPTLASAFFADPDITAGQRGGSGLICEWQQFSGTLIAGGNSKHIRCWDLAAEQCGTVIETNSEACVTTLTTAWDSDHGAMSTGYQGMGPDIIVAGHGDGTLKLFDIRAPQNAAAAVTPGRRSRGRPTMFTEHASWIVDTSFTGYGGRFEIISGSVAGDVRAWDLRASSSLRTLDVQRSPMTALSVHKQIPIAATGSHAQFIKIMTLEGETLQVARFHEEMKGHRIGPVSCLEFHKHKLLLAAGATNSLVSIYEPKHKPLR